MAEKICPHMTGAHFGIVFCNDGTPRPIEVPADEAGIWTRECQLWENEDCGLKVRRGDRYKLMWEALRGYLPIGSVATKRMDRLEAEMGGKDA